MLRGRFSTSLSLRRVYSGFRVEGSSLTPRFKGAPRASVTTRRDHQQFALATKIWRTPHAPVSRHAANSERVVAGTKIRGLSRRNTTRHAHREGRNLSSFLRTLHVPASRRATITEMVVTYAQHFEDAPCWYRCEKEDEKRIRKPIRDSLRSDSRSAPIRSSLVRRSESCRPRSDS